MHFWGNWSWFADEQEKGADFAHHPTAAEAYNASIDV
jgi:hypothetical protein